MSIQMLGWFFHNAFGFALVPDHSFFGGGFAATDFYM